MTGIRKEHCNIFYLLKTDTVLRTSHTLSVILTEGNNLAPTYKETYVRSQTTWSKSHR